MQANQIATEGVDLSPINFSALSEGFGAAYRSANTIAALLAAISEATSGDGPVVIEIKEDAWRAE